MVRNSCYTIAGNLTYSSLFGFYVNFWLISGISNYDFHICFHESLCFDRKINLVAKSTSFPVDTLYYLLSVACKSFLYRNGERIEKVFLSFSEKLCLFTIKKYNTIIKCMSKNNRLHCIKIILSDPDSKYKRHKYHIRD